MSEWQRRQEKRDLESARIGASIERGHVVDWLRARGQKNKSVIYFTLADEIAALAHIPHTLRTALPKGEAVSDRLSRALEAICLSAEEPHNMGGGYKCRVPLKLILDGQEALAWFRRSTPQQVIDTEVRDG